MPRFNEETLTSWTKPPSDTEETMLERAEKMVRDAINEDDKLKEKSIEIFGQGSYVNNTNVKQNSDIDINVKYTGGYYYKIPEGRDKSDFFTHIPTSYSYSEFKDDVEQALINKFGNSSVRRDDKCITVLANSSRVETDVVPTWNYKKFFENGSYVLGSKFKTDSGKWIINYPKQHIKNGINKNDDTSRRYKRLTRLHKKLRYKMIDDGIPVNGNITSFLLECLVWNVPNNIFNDYDTWNDRLRYSIIYLYDSTKEENDCSKWVEVSKLLYLFVGHKWSKMDVNNYMYQLWQYLRYS